MAEINVLPGDRSLVNVNAERVGGHSAHSMVETLAVEEPLEIQLGYGTAVNRKVKSISVTMRTPGNDFELAVGFLMTEGVIRDANDIDRIEYASTVGDLSEDHAAKSILPYQPRENIIRVDLSPEIIVSLANLERNFYVTSSCGICGKASLLALQSICPPRARSMFSMPVEVIYTLPDSLREVQSLFSRTGGLHGAGLFNAQGELQAVREDVGRHNAVDKLLGAQFLADRTPLRNSLLLLSGRASFELLQKAVMGGIAMVASVGAPSSLAVRVAREFDIPLIGFLRNNHFNVYYGSQYISGLPSIAEQGAV